jgi:hypothetical protein
LPMMHHKALVLPKTSWYIHHAKKQLKFEELEWLSWVPKI